MKNKKQMLLSEYVRNDLETYKKFRCNATLDKYAKSVGISRTIMYEILAGKHNAPKPFFAVRLCRAFDLDPDELIEMITNADDEFLDKFIKLYDGNAFEDSCKRAIEYFYNMNCYDYLYDDEPLDSSDYGQNYYSFSDLQFVNIKEESKYNPSCYNATCTCAIFDVNEVLDGDDPDMLDDTGFFTSELIGESKFSIYYLPHRRIRKENSKVYPDEEFRDFSNKLLYLLTHDDVPENNVFLTTSKSLYDKITNYFGEIKVKPDNGIGVALVYCQHKRAQEVFAILENSDMIQGPVFGY